MRARSLIAARVVWGSARLCLSAWMLRVSVDLYAREVVITEDHVRVTFGQVAQWFIDARVRTFLPILIERAVRRELAG